MKSLGLISSAILVVIVGLVMNSGWNTDAVPSVATNSITFDLPPNLPSTVEFIRDGEKQSEKTSSTLVTSTPGTSTSEEVEAENISADDYIERAWTLASSQNDAEAISEAYILFEKAAMMGDSVAAFNAGQYVYFRKITIEPLETAREWFALAAKLDFPPAKYNLAIMMYNGVGGDENIEEAIKLFHQAAQAGHEQAQQALDQIDRAHLMAPLGS